MYYSKSSQRYPGGRGWAGSLCADKGVSEAFLIREAVDSYVVGLEREESGNAASNPLLRLVGLHKEPIPPDLAKDHDRYLERENDR